MNKKNVSMRRRPTLWGRTASFVRQVVAELRKVVSPTRNELFRMTAIVLAFVAVAMAFVTTLDLGVGKLVFVLFGD